MNDIFNFGNEVKNASERALDLCREQFSHIDEITQTNQQKVLKAFIDNRVSESCFNASTGYGYSDKGRDTLDNIFADIFGAQDALVRHSLASGTHAITTALFGVLRPGDTMLCVTGAPYDTLLGVIDDLGKGKGSLKDFGITYEQVDMLPCGGVDFDGIKLKLKQNPKMVYIQRSRGYTLRDSLSIAVIKQIIDIVRSISPNSVVMVDNCYGEFVEISEPPCVGADLIAGSLIKNPGGAIAPCGGYIAGRKDLVELCSYRLTTPSTGREVGASLGYNRELYLGIFNAPHITGEALKATVFSAALFSLLGFEVSPQFDDRRFDIVQSVMLGDEKSLIAFCRGLQQASPVDSFLSPEPWDMPGYDSKVVMASGAFTLGSSIELSADAPLREPFAVFLQGGVNFHSARVGIESAADAVLNVRNGK